MERRGGPGLDWCLGSLGTVRPESLWNGIFGLPGGHRTSILFQPGALVQLEEAIIVLYNNDLKG